MSVNAFFNAARDGNSDIVLDFLNGGQDVNERTAVGASALELASGSGEETIVGILLDAGAKTECDEIPCFTSPLILASTYDHPEIVDLLLSNGAIPDVQDEEGQTALIWATSHESSISIIKALLDAGADPNLKDSRGNSAIDYAKGFDYKEILSLLEK